jgi:hypothetical protein
VVTVKQALAPLCAAICVPIAAVVAYFLDADVLLAALGAGLVLVYAALEYGAAWLGQRGSFNQAIGVGVGGMMLRMIVVLGALAVVGWQTSKADTLTCIAAFIGTFTIYFIVRLTVMPFQLKTGPQPPAPGRDGGGRDGRGEGPDETMRRASAPRPASGAAAQGSIKT